MGIAKSNQRLGWMGYAWPDPGVAVTEVTAAKARLVELTDRPRDVSAWVQQHPLASVAGAFGLGMLLGKGSTWDMIREGIVLGLRSAVTSGLR